MKIKKQKVMRNKVEKLSVAFALAFTITSCGSDDDNPSPENHKPVANVSITADDLTVGKELTASAKGDDEDGDNVNFKYQWYRSSDDELQKEGDDKDTAIEGATESTYTLQEDDVDNFIIVEVIPNDDEVDGDAVTAVTSDKVKAANKKPVAKVELTGTFESGNDITADTTGSTDEDGDASKITFTYKWYRSDDNTLEKEGDDADTAIEAKSDDASKYTVVDDDKGKYIFVEVTPKDEKGLEGEAVTTSKQIKS